MSEKLTLLDNSSDSEVDFQINESYAKKYKGWRKGEEFQKYKDFKKRDDESESSSESEEEILESDEEFFRALSLIKGEDHRIYDPNYEMFKNKEVVKKAKIVKQKPMYMKDYERNLVIERAGKFSDEEDEHISSNKLLYDEEQLNLKKSFNEALIEDDEDDDLLQVRTNTKIKNEDDGTPGLRNYLRGEKSEVSEDVKKDLFFLKNHWTNVELSDDDEVLKKYFLNEGYKEKDDSELPTYDEIKLSDDEKMIEKQEKFEYKYNFRFEEPDEEFIKRYPRTIGDSLRKTDNRRKLKRDEKIERKKREREQRKEELKRLKALKRKEIEEKFSKLKEVCGKEEINLNESDMESDFDPDKHDQKMREMFNEDYYNIEEELKPEFPYDAELVAENWNAWGGEKIDEEDKIKQSDISETVNENIKLTDPKDEFEKEMIEATLPKKRVRKKSLFAKVISQPKPIYDPDGKSFDEYLDEYYKLDYEDIVGDMPVRYKYRKVIPNDFGLSVEEILTADDRELNRWCSVKKTCQYRNDDEEIYDVQAYKKKSLNALIKKKVFSSLYSSKEPDNEVDGDSLFYKSNKRDFFLDEETNSSISLKNQDLMVNEENNTAHSNSNKVTEQEVSFLQKKECKEKLKKKLKENFEAEEHTDNVPADEKLHLSDARPAKKKKKFSSEETFTSSSLRHDGAIINAEMDTTYSNSNETEEEKLNQDFSVQTIDSSFISENSQVHSGKKKNKKKKNKSGTSTNSKQDDAVVSEKMDVTHSNLYRVKDKESNPDSSVHNIHSSFVSKSSHTYAKKKKNEKKKNKNNALNEVASNYMGHNKSKVANKFNNKKHSENASGDKRLGLSDERLAAYGINPKKFKNRIIYSKK